MAEKALTAVFEESCIQRSRSARWTALDKALGMGVVSKNQVSCLCEETSASMLSSRG